MMDAVFAVAINPKPAVGTPAWFRTCVCAAFVEVGLGISARLNMLLKSMRKLSS